MSTSTVSRVLDERLPRSNSAAAQRVREAAERMGYIRDLHASQLRRSGTDTIGVIVPRLTDPTMAILFEEISAACRDRGLFAVVATTHDDAHTERVAINTLRQRRVDGLILTTARLPSGNERTPKPALPYVLALRTDGVGPASVGDDRLGGRLATRHLIDLGHRRIGLIAGPTHASSAQGRLAGYRQALLDAGIDDDDTLIAGRSYSLEAGEQAGHQLLALPDRPTAIFATNDNTAIGVMAAAHTLGLRIPDDLSLVGYNDIPIVRRLPVPLTTVRVPLREIAYNAVRLLLDNTDDEPATLVVPPTLIPRRSAAMYR